MGLGSSKRSMVNCREKETKMDGTPLENMGQQPDFRVEISNDDYFAGRDPQLDKAIEVLMEKVR